MAPEPTDYNQADQADMAVPAEPVPAQPREDRDHTPEMSIEGDSDRPILVWEAKEFAEHTRDRRWYLTAGVIGGVLTIIALILQWWLTAVVFVLATVVVIRHADDPPRQLQYSLSRLGVHVGEKFYPYNELKTFWLIYKPPVRTVTLQTVNRFKPLIKIDLAEVDPLKVKKVLKYYLPEEAKKEEDFLDKFSRWIRL